MKIKKILATIVTSLSLAFASSLSATVITEEPSDAGDTLASAQFLPGGTTEVHGSILSSLDVDIFGFGWSGGDFLASTSKTGSLSSNQIQDTQLFLFDALGAGLWFNDDAVDFYSELNISGLDAGLYYIAVSGWDNDPLNDINELIFENTFTGMHDPLDNITNTVLADWTGGNDWGDYILTLSPGTGPLPVPETGTLLLLLLGGGLLVLRRRQH